MNITKVVALLVRIDNEMEISEARTRSVIGRRERVEE
jgi:hypothetical protein